MLGEFGIVYRAVLTTAEKEPQPVAAKTLKGKHVPSIVRLTSLPVSY